MKQLLVFGAKTFKLSVPDDAKITFGPFSPPGKHGFNGQEERAKGTLRIYQGNKENILACFSQVVGFRDLSLDYSEEVAKEEGAVIWKSDKNGYQREEKVKREADWINPTPMLAAPKKRK